MTKKAAGGMSVFVVTDVADEKVANILDEKFNMSTTMPDNPKSDYYNSSSARIIDEYKLTSNNCTTMVYDVLNKSGSNALKGTRLQQTSNLGTWTTIPIVNRFVLPISMQNHLVRISKPGGVVYKTRQIMKWLRIVFVATSIILSLVIVCAIINCEISYKYEIENRCGDKIDILWVEEWLKETIKVWQFFLCYVIINIFYLVASLVNSRKSSKEKCSLS